MSMIIVGGVIEKDNKYLLIQEAKPSCYGKWNLPAGHLDPGENLFEGAKREIKEESGCDVELTGVCQIGNRKRNDDGTFVAIVFTAKIIHENLVASNPKEILNIKWFGYDEILAMHDQIRNPDLMIGAIDNIRQGITAPLEIVKIYQAGAEFQNVTIKEI